ncbi:NIL domain-containing protein (plasmid) [Kovacikia minuta CCNUW1]|uniref:NIL domain-containing protein n=1 Tax=Kovacikia minuta TaxID=2931930 RepID=UPI001CCB8C14|nr:NIL domain-containing protein [Kovacikia minuta]UBF30609.1 NIL domain-containing protein [Kovacikia minuta CCNUW1]
MNQARVRLYLLPSYQQEPVISDLVRKHRLTVNITGAQLGQPSNSSAWTDSDSSGWIDLELQGSNQQITNGLAFLASLHLKVVGKPNVMGDSWHY